MQKIRDWFRRHFSNPQVVFLALMLLGGFLTIIFFGRMLAPALAALVLAYLLDGIVVRFEKHKMPRLAAVISVYSVSMISFFMLLLILIPHINTQTRNFAYTVLPEIVNDVIVQLEEWNEKYENLKVKVDTFLEPEEPYVFSENDILDFPALVEKLRDPENPVSTRLRSQMNESVLLQLADFEEGVTDPSELEASLLDLLNRVLREPVVFEEKTFEGVTLREETQELLNAEDTEKIDRVHLNRMVLEDVFPEELARATEPSPAPATKMEESEIASVDSQENKDNSSGQFFPLVGGSTSTPLFDIPQITEDLQSRIGEISGVVVKFSLGSIGTVVGILIYMVLVPVLVFFLLKDKHRLISWVSRFLPRDRALATGVWHDVNLQTSNYIRGKFWEIIIVWSVTHITFTLFGLKSSLILSFFVGLSVLVPYIGATVMYLPISLIAFYQFEDSTSTVIWILVAYSIIQILDGNVLAPILLSEVTNLHPIAVIMAVLVFGGVWGFWGVFFAIPLATLVNAVINAWPKDLPSNTETGGSSPPAEAEINLGN